MIKPWKRLSTRPAGDFRVFNIRADLKESPRTGNQHEFYILESVNWVNVVAVTPDEELVLVRQYRHGSNTVELEVPGGMMDAADRDPVITAARELLEETGYAGKPGKIIGQVFANPAIMSNTCYTVLIEGCQCVGGVALDAGEDIATELMPLENIPDLIRAGEIKHSLVVAALFHFSLARKS